MIRRKGIKGQGKLKHTAKKSKKNQLKITRYDTQSPYENGLNKVDNDLSKVKDDTVTERKSHKKQLNELKEKDPDFYQFLLENDENLLNFSSESEQEEDDVSNSGKKELVQDGMQGDSLDEVRSGDESADSEEGEVEEEEEEGDSPSSSEGQTVTMEMVRKWCRQMSKSHSLCALKELTSSLHCGVVSILTTPDGNNDVPGASDPIKYQVRGRQVFNAIVIGCLRHVRSTLDHHLPDTGNSSVKPSSVQDWRGLKMVIKQYLMDTLQLIQSVSQSSMICALLRHIEAICRFFPCFPKLCRLLCRNLITVWSEKKEEASVLSYLILRKLICNFGDYKLEDLMKRMYLAYVRNSRLTTPSTLQHIQFMCGTFMDFLSVSPSLAYQLIFLYARHLANRLRSAFKGQKQGSLASWPFIHSLELFVSVLSTLSDDVFTPLIYPVTQVSLGMIQLLSAGKFTPLRLHIVRILIEISESRGTFIPLAPILLEVLESHSLTISRKSATGKIPSLSCTLKLSKIQVGSRASQMAVLNYTLELLLRLLSLYSNYISFPELVYPILVRLRKVLKKTPLSWLRQHLRQIVEKSNEVSKKITSDRSALNFSPKNEDKIRAWETLRKEQKNPLMKFFDTWKTIQQRQEQYEELERQQQQPEEETESTSTAENKRKNRKRKAGSAALNQPPFKQQQQLATNDDDIPDLSELDEAEDIIEDFKLSSDEEL